MMLPNLSLFDAPRPAISPSAILEALRAAGAVVAAAGDKLRVAAPPGRKLPSHLLEAVRANKGALLSLLAVETHQAEQLPALPPLDQLQRDPYFIRAKARILPSFARQFPGDVDELAYHLARLDMELPGCPSATAGKVWGEEIDAAGNRFFDAGAAYRPGAYKFREGEPDNAQGVQPSSEVYRHQKETQGIGKHRHYGDTGGTE